MRVCTPWAAREDPRLLTQMYDPNFQNWSDFVRGIRPRRGPKLSGFDQGSDFLAKIVRTLDQAIWGSENVRIQMDKASGARIFATGAPKHTEGAYITRQEAVKHT